jgi:filamentous hemagglutinin
MGKSYDAQLDGLLWKYATADAQAEKERNIQILVSKGIPENVAAGLVTVMAAVHTAAAIGGAVYGMKGEMFLRQISQYKKWRQKGRPV